MIAMPKQQEYLSLAIVYPTSASIDRSSFNKSKKKEKKSIQDYEGHTKIPCAIRVIAQYIIVLAIFML